MQMYIILREITNADVYYPSSAEYALYSVMNRFTEVYLAEGVLSDESPHSHYRKTTARISVQHPAR